MQNSNEQEVKVKKKKMDPKSFKMKKTKKMQNLKLFYQIISKCELFERRVFHIFYIFNESKYKEVDGRCHKV